MTPAPSIPTTFTIHVGATIDRGWTEWLDGADIVAAEDGTGLITAVGCDQAMLLGLLTRIRDLGIPLLGVYPGSAVRQPDPSCPH
jgi:hypothetical protein